MITKASLIEARTYVGTGYTAPPTTSQLPTVPGDATVSNVPSSAPDVAFNAVPDDADINLMGNRTEGYRSLLNPGATVSAPPSTSVDSGGGLRKLIFTAAVVGGLYLLMKEV